MSFPIQTPSQIAAHLRALRAAKGWSQAQLGSKLGLSQARVARIEKDPLTVSMGQLLSVLNALGAGVAITVDSNSPDSPASHGTAILTAPMPTLTATGTVASARIAKSNQGEW